MKWKKLHKHNEFFSSIAGVAFEHILKTLSSPEHSSRIGKKIILAELLIPGLGQYFLKKKNAKYILIAYGCWLIVDLFLILSVCFIPLVFCIELGIRAICLKLLTTPKICECCGSHNIFSALYCSHCNNSFDKDFVVCPNCRELTRKGVDICENCESDIAHVQNVKLCPQCEKENDVEAQFCSGCGIDLTMKRVFSNCPECDQALKPSDLFCSQCGKSVIDIMHEDNYSGTENKSKSHDLKYNQSGSE